MKYIYGHDTFKPNDFAVRVSDKVYEAMKKVEKKVVEMIAGRVGDSCMKSSAFREKE